MFGVKIPPQQLCSGPGKLCQTLDVNGRLYDMPVPAEPFTLVGPVRPVEMAQGRRIGVPVGTETAWWFVEAGSPFLSRPDARKPANAPQGDRGPMTSLC